MTRVAGSQGVITKTLGVLSGQRKALRLVSRERWLTLINLGAMQAGTVFMGLASSALIGRKIPLDVYGQYQVVLSAVGIVAGFCLPGLAQSVTISAAKRYDGNLWRIIRLKLIVNSAGALALAAAATYYFMQSDSSLSIGFAIAAIMFPMYQLHDIWPAWLSGRGKLNLLSLLQTGSNLAGLATLAAIVLTDNATLPLLLLSGLGVSVLLSVVTTVSFLSTRSNDITDRDTIQYGLHVTAASILSSLTMTDKLVINAHLSVSEVAVYSVASQFSDQIKKVHSSFNQLLQPGIYRTNTVTEGWAYLSQRFLSLMAFFAFLGVVGYFAIPVFIPMVFSDRYLAAVPHGQWMWLGFALAMPPNLLGSILRSQKKVAFTYAQSIGYPILCFLVYNIGTGFGLAGVVAARVGVQYVNVALYTIGLLYYLRREKSRSPAQQPESGPDAQISHGNPRRLD